jgi:hypothetical protein
MYPHYSCWWHDAYKLRLARLRGDHAGGTILFVRLCVGDKGVRQTCALQEEDQVDTGNLIGLLHGRDAGQRGQGLFFLCVLSCVFLGDADGICRGRRSPFFD